MRTKLFTVCAAAAACLSIAAPAAASMSAAGFGINGQVLLWQMNQSAWNVHLSEMHADGIRVVRTDAPWAVVEPQAPLPGRSSYSWSHIDQLVAALAEHGLRWEPVVDYSTPWDASAWSGGQPDLYSPPSTLSPYASYAGALAARYGPGGTFWHSGPARPPMPVQAIEIWNEENGYFWQPYHSPAQYAELYESARQAAHAANARVEVLVGGLVDGADTFIEQMYGALGGTRRPFDAVALHTYAPSAAASIEQVVRARAVLDAHGDVNTPIDVTEFGWPTSGLQLTGPAMIVSDAQRAQMLTQVVDQLARSDCGVERIEPYAWTTSEWNILDEEDWYGIVHPSGSANRTGVAYAAEIAAADAAPDDGMASLSLCGRSLSVTLAGARHRPRPRRACLRATVSSDRAPVSHAAVTVVVSGDGAPRRLQLPATDAAGQTQGCVRLARPGPLTATATARRWDFAGPAQTTARFLIR